MYSKIIVPLDGSELSEQALPYARLVARSLAAPIELVQAFDMLPPRVLGAHTDHEMAGRLERSAQRRAQEYLASAAEPLAADGYAVSYTALHGAPAEAVVSVASADPAALVVMSTHGRGGIARWVMGSVTDKVLHMMPNPMLIVRATATGPAAPQSAVQTVVVPLDGSPLAELALPHAISIAAALGSGITLLRVTPTEEYYRYQLTVTPDMASIPDFDGVSAGELAASDAQDVAAYLADVENRLATDHAQGVVADHRQHQNVAQAIIAKTGEQPALVVMTTHGRSGVGRVVLGSITDRVVRHSNVPVLVIR